MVIGGISLTIGLIYLVKKLTKDPYQSERGFFAPTNWMYYWRRPHYYRRYHSGGVTKEGKPVVPPITHAASGHSFHSGGCACACACACAGGGRAGCSMKDFYHTNLRTDELKEVFNKEKC